MRWYDHTVLLVAPLSHTIFTRSRYTLSILVKHLQLLRDLVKLLRHLVKLLRDLVKLLLDLVKLLRLVIILFFGALIVLS